MVVSIDRLKVYQADDREQRPARKNLSCENDPHCEAFDLPSSDSSSDESFDQDSGEELEANDQGGGDDDAVADAADAVLEEEARAEAGPEPQPEAEAAEEAGAGAGAPAMEEEAGWETAGEESLIETEDEQTPFRGGAGARRGPGRPRGGYATPTRRTPTSAGARPKTGTKKRPSWARKESTPTHAMSTRHTEGKKKVLPMRYKDFEMEVNDDEEEEEDLDATLRASHKGEKSKKK